MPLQPGSRTLATLALLLAAAAPASAQTVREFVFHFPADGPQRTYLVYQPDSYCPADPAVVALHGGAQSMRIVLDETSPQARWTDLADDFGFLLIAPNGFREARPGESASGLTDVQSWNDLRPNGETLISSQDDSAFIAEVIRRAHEDFAFDPRAVFVSGPSNGGMMTYRMLIDRPDLFAAGCAFIANLPEAEIPLPPVARPIMIMNGDADPLMPWLGGPTGFGAPPVRSAAATLAWWLDQHGLTSEEPVATTLPNNEPVDRTQIKRFEYLATDGVSPSPVLFFRVVDGGHAIPVLPGDPGVLGGRQSLDTRGVDHAWNFFQTHLPPPCPADLDGDAQVGSSDLAQLLGGWGPAPGCADVSENGRAEPIDLSLLLGAWGPCP